MLTNDHLHQIVAVLLPEMDDTDDRKALIESALYGSPVLQKIQWNGAAKTFAVRLVRLLTDFGEIKPGKPALIALLEQVKKEVGSDRQIEIDELLTSLKAPPDKQEIQPPPKTFVEGELYVFISYARLDEPIAKKVEAFLTAAGVRVFRDKSNIGPGVNWDLTIEEALLKCQRMVLLLSPSSMKSKEVYNEWFPFDQKRKKIFPLYLQDCELHRRFYSLNYIDARSDLQSALERILDDLKRDFALPPAVKVEEKAISAEAEARTLPAPLQALLDEIRNPKSSSPSSKPMPSKITSLPI